MDQQQTDENPACGQSASTELLGVPKYAFRDEGDEAEARFLSEQLFALRESFAKMEKPYLERLAVLHGRKRMSMLVSLERAQELGLLTPNDDIKGRA